MTINTKQLLSTSMMSLAIAVLTFSQCKSPTAPAETTPVAQVDSTAIDTTVKAAPTALPDTTAKRKGRPPLTLLIQNLRSDTAPVVVGLYGTHNKFPSPKDQLKEYHFKPHASTLTAYIDDQQYGTYALAIYQDVNSNGKIDKNMIGIPTEPYAFSNNYKPRIKAPNFNDCKFQYDSISNTVSMTLLK
jgi:uncharacterized protein (DUF2141 family)